MASATPCPGWYSITSPPTIVRGVVVIGAQVRDGQDEDAPSGVVRGYDAVTGELALGLGPRQSRRHRRAARGRGLYPRHAEHVDHRLRRRGARPRLPAARQLLGRLLRQQPQRRSRTSTRPRWSRSTSRPASTSGTSRPSTTTSGTTTSAARRRWSTSRPPTAPVPALVLPSKQGDIYVLDRRTGEPLTGSSSAQTPQGGVEPDYLAPTQPFSAYHTLAKRDLTEARHVGHDADRPAVVPHPVPAGGLRRHLHAADQPTGTGSSIPATTAAPTGAASRSIPSAASSSPTTTTCPTTTGW